MDAVFLRDGSVAVKSLMGLYFVIIFKPFNTHIARRVLFAAMCLFAVWIGFLIRVVGKIQFLLTTYLLYIYIYIYYIVYISK